MTDATVCPGCGTALPPGAPAGPCARCLLAAGLASGPGAERAGPPAPEEMARHFPHLEVLEVLGQGGMGVVYKARHRRLDRLVALKVLPPEAAREPGFPERFTREARTLARLQHPHIVAVHDFGETDGLFWLVMEFVDGPNLRQVIREGRLEPAQALAIVPQVCDALQYAHDRGVVHRDIKPENLLLDREGKVRVADFGLAKIVQRAPVDVTLTREGQVMGTLHYMAPEQYRAPDTVDHRADIYSLGVVFYEMLTGELPVGVFPPPSGKAHPDARLDAVVLRALEKERERRWQHASDVKTEVDSIVTGRAAGSPPTETAPPPAAASPPPVAAPPSDEKRARIRIGPLDVDVSESDDGRRADVRIGGSAVEAAVGAALRSITGADDGIGDETDDPGASAAGTRERPRARRGRLAIASAFGLPPTVAVGALVADAAGSPVAGIVCGSLVLVVSSILGAVAWMRIHHSGGRLRGLRWAVAGTLLNAALLCFGGPASFVLLVPGAVDRAGVPEQSDGPDDAEPWAALKVVGSAADLDDAQKRALVRAVEARWSECIARYGSEVNPDVRAARYGPAEALYGPADHAAWRSLPLQRREDAERMSRLGLPFLDHLNAQFEPFRLAWVAVGPDGTRARVVRSDGQHVLSYPIARDGGAWRPAIGLVEFEQRLLEDDDRCGWLQRVQGQGMDPAERVTGGPATFTPEERAALADALGWCWQSQAGRRAQPVLGTPAANAGLRLFHAILADDGRSGRVVLTDGRYTVGTGFRRETGWVLDPSSTWLRFGPATEADRLSIPLADGDVAPGTTPDPDIERDACLVHGGLAGRSAAELAAVARAIRTLWKEKGPEYVRRDVPMNPGGATVRIPGGASDYSLFAVALDDGATTGRAVFGSGTSAVSVPLERDGDTWVLGAGWEVRFAPPTKDDEDGLLFR